MTQIPDVYHRIDRAISALRSRIGAGAAFGTDEMYAEYVALYPADVAAKADAGPHGLRGYLNGMMANYAKRHPRSVTHTGTLRYQMLDNHGEV